jgi:hypothetical protein
MDERTHEAMASVKDLEDVAEALSLILAMLIEDLDKSGQISRVQFAARLRRDADEAERTAPEHNRGDRVDLQIARHLADVIDPPSSGSSWTPIVIKGGDE